MAESRPHAAHRVAGAATDQTIADWPVPDLDALRARIAGLLRSGAVTVRSSAVGEDSEAKSYAGLFETSRDGPIRIGLVVQRHLKPRAAGVAFTIDPQGKDRAIAAEAIRLAERLGQPLDLEWAEDEAGLHWLQARSITAAKAPIEWAIDRLRDDVADGPVSVWSNFNVRETMPLPFSPLNASLWREIVLPGVLDGALGIPRGSPLGPHLAGIDFVHGRLYWNLNAMMAGPLGRLLPRMLPLLDARAAEVARDLEAAGVLRPRRLPRGQLRLALHRALTGIRSAARCSWRCVLARRCASSSPMRAGSGSVRTSRRCRTQPSSPSCACCSRPRRGRCVAPTSRSRWRSSSGASPTGLSGTRSAPGRC